MSQCYANPNPIFQPAMRLIASITNANPATVTTTFNNQYQSGLIVRLDLPLAVGMQEANGLTGTITVINATTFTINIDTTNFSAFLIPVSPGPFDNTCAQVIPIGEVNGQLGQATRNILP
jgi:hypothetical protein